MPESTPKTGPVPVAGGDLVAVSLIMPARHAPAFQMGALQLLVELNGGAPDPDTYRPPYSNTYGPKDAWALPAWQDPADEPAARWILGELGPKQRKVIALVLAAGPDGIWTNDLRHASGYGDAAGMSGVFKAIGGRFRRCGRRPVWNGGEKQPGKGQLLSAQDPVALAVFVRALLAEHPGLAGEVGLA
jgi:hypothetical protein